MNRTSLQTNYDHVLSLAPSNHPLQHLSFGSNPRGFPHWKSIFVNFILDAINCVQNAPEFTSDRITWEQDGMPTYWLAPELLESLENTTLPAGVSSNQIDYPLDRMLLIFPIKGNQPYLGSFTGFHPADCRSSHRIPVLAVLISKSFMHIIHESGLIDGVIPICSVKLDVLEDAFQNRTLAEIMNISDETLNAWSQEHDRLMQDMPTSPMPDPIQIYTAILAIFLMARAIPEFIDPGNVRYTASEKDIRKGRKTILKPRWIGNGYKLKTENNARGSDGKTVRTHWRRGHFRLQHFGPKNSMAKYIWIQPILINPIIINA